SPACAVVFLASSRFRRDPPSFPTRRSSDLRANSNAFEINCENGSIAFDMERLNELEVDDKQGFKRLLVTEPGHPFMRFWWPHGRAEEHTSELQSLAYLVCRLLPDKNRRDDH